MLIKTLYDCYSRLLIDNHISDLKPGFMSKFDPAEYVRMVKLAGVESAMVYACDHNGNCYYPTRAGHMHTGLHGRDIFGETVALLRENGIVPVAYYTVIYHNGSASAHPEWRMRDILGHDRNGRYRFSCPNNPAYREFCCAQIGEIMSYPLDGLFIDMTFWPMVCCCVACRAAFGRPIPEVIDWNSPEWVAFQRFRERSMADFAREMTAYAKARQPALPLTYQFSPVLHGWRFGQSPELAAEADYSSGDFYGGKLQQRLGVKVFEAFSRRVPYEFMTSRCVTLFDHTSTKSDEELFLHAVTTLLNGGAYFFIDAINPDGTLEEPFYRRLHEIIRRLEPFKQVIAAHRPRSVAETGVYFSMASCVDENCNGMDLRDLRDRNGNMVQHHNPVLDELLGTTIVLNQLHVPYKIVTECTEDFTGLKTIIVNHAAFMSEPEAERLRGFVRAGGTLLATGPTSLEPGGNFRLADVFGVDYSGRSTDRVNYLETGGHMLLGQGSSPLVTARPETEVLGAAVLPEFPPDDPDRYASIHSNPPAVQTGHAGLTEHRFGAGKCIYLYSGLMAEQSHSHRSFMRGLLKSCVPEFVAASRNLPDSAEVTLLQSEDGKTLLLGIVNYQDELPNIPLIDLEITVKVPEPRRVLRLKREVPFTYRGGGLTLNLERLDDAELFELIY